MTLAKLKTIEAYQRLREQARRDIRVRRNTETKISVGMGTCGIAAGARETLQAIVKALRTRNIEANVTTVGCIGMCAFEPLVDVEQAGGSRITYGPVRADMVPTLIDEHLIAGRVVTEWVVGRMRGQNI